MRQGIAFHSLNSGHTLHSDEVTTSIIHQQISCIQLVHFCGENAAQPRGIPAEPVSTTSPKDQSIFQEAQWKETGERVLPSAIKIQAIRGDLDSLRLPHYFTQLVNPANQIRSKPNE